MSWSCAEREASSRLAALPHDGGQTRPSSSQDQAAFLRELAPRVVTASKPRRPRGAARVDEQHSASAVAWLAFASPGWGRPAEVRQLAVRSECARPADSAEIERCARLAMVLIGRRWNIREAPSVVEGRRTYPMHLN
jgi:hypothetical protein